MLIHLLLIAALGLPAQAEPLKAVPANQPSPSPAEEFESLPGLAEPFESSGLAGNSRPGRPFTKKQKQIVKQENAAANEGKNRCENCGVETVPGQKHQKGVTPPKNETQVDHIIPRVEGGPGDVDNAQVLCRECNIDKGAKMPEGSKDHGTK